MLLSTCTMLSSTCARFLASVLVRVLLPSIPVWDLVLSAPSLSFILLGPLSPPLSVVCLTHGYLWASALVIPVWVSASSLPVGVLWVLARVPVGVFGVSW
jgi:hypothetical protein